MNDRPTSSSSIPKMEVVRGTTGEVQQQPATPQAGADTGFLPDERMGTLRSRWDDVQAGFVDDPQNSVQRAHALVNDLVNELNETFTRERTALEGQWQGGGTADTETLRIALQRYRSFFNRLLGT